jgi:hypothetical protein
MNARMIFLRRSWIDPVRRVCDDGSMRMGLAIMVVAILPSCGLLRAPVKIVGGVVQGTTKVTKAAVDAPKEAWDKRKARKEAESRDAEARRKSGRDAGPTMGDPSPVGGQAPDIGGGSGPPIPTSGGPSLPDGGQPLDPADLPPLPE